MNTEALTHVVRCRQPAQEVFGTRCKMFLGRRVLSLTLVYSVLLFFISSLFWHHPLLGGPGGQRSRPGGQPSPDSRHGSKGHSSPTALPQLRRRTRGSRELPSALPSS